MRCDYCFNKLLCLSEWTFHVTWARSKKMSELYKCEIFCKITMKYEKVMKIVEAMKNVETFPLSCVPIFNGKVVLDSLSCMHWRLRRKTIKTAIIVKLLATQRNEDAHINFISVERGNLQSLGLTHILRDQERPFLKSIHVIHRKLLPPSAWPHSAWPHSLPTPPPPSSPSIYT